GEDGQLQAILSARKLAYTGSGPGACRLAFDKRVSKNVFIAAGIRTPKAIEFNGKTNARQLRDELAYIADKFVVKPAKQGSSVGISIVEGAKATVKAARRCFKKFGNCIIEQYIAGREITVGILNGQGLPIIEIRSATGFYDYKAKYLDRRTEFLFDTIKDDHTRAEIARLGLKCFKALTCLAFTRVDFILADDGRLYALELNTTPGFTEHSLLPKAAERADIPMPQLCLSIVKAALESRPTMLQRKMPGNMTVIKAQVPLAEVSNYDSSLKSVTGGQGSYSMTLSHYEQVPSNVQQQVVAQYAKKSSE
ncbi:unnamed protein product, partial [marine sediment metagenome]